MQISCMYCMHVCMYVEEEGLVVSEHTVHAAVDDITMFYKEGCWSHSGSLSKTHTHTHLWFK